MKTVILGAGALGTVLAAHLARAGHEVTVVAREPRASLLRRDGVRVTGLAEIAERVEVLADPAPVRACDLLVNALKTYQSAPVLAAMRGARPALAFSVQNGVYKNVELAEAFGRDRVLGATALISAEVQPDGAARFTMNESLLLGELDGGESERCRALAAALKAAGIAASTSPAIVGVEWSKVCLFVPSFCLALLTRMQTHRFLRHRDGAATYVELAREMARLAAAEGVTVPDSGPLALSAIAALPFDEAVQQVQAFGTRLAQAAPQHKVSGLQDLERGRPTEVDEIVGHALRRSEALGLQSPALRTAYWLCRVVSPAAAVPAVA